MRKILVLHDIPQYKDKFDHLAPDFEVVFSKSKEDAMLHIGDSEIIIGWNDDLRQAISNEETKVRWIQSVNAGVNAFPLDLLKEHNIALTKATGVHPNQLSESVFATILALERNLKQSILSQEKSQWDKSISSLAFGEIHNKTIGIIGAGEIGQEIAKVAGGFSMYTIGVKRSTSAVPYLDEIFTMEDIKTVVNRCDYIVNILPSTPETVGLFNKELFDSMMNDTRFFNFGRGDSVVTEDLIGALESGKIAAAGLDVTEPEPLPPDSPLWSMKNVIITPHIAGNTPYYYDRLIDGFLENLDNYINYRPFNHAKVDLNSGY